MSFVLLRAAWRAHFHGPDKVVLARLCDLADDAGMDIYPSVSTLAAECGISTRAVQTALRNLQSAGVLVLVAEAGAVRRTRTYRVDVDALNRTATPAPPAPLHEVHPRTTCTPPPQEVHPTPAPPAPKRSIRDQINEEVASAPPAPRAPMKSERGTRLPPDWSPSPELEAWAKAERPDLDLIKTLEAFRDYWTSQPGRHGVKLDWAATLRNWIRKERPAFPSRQVPAAPAPVQFVDGEDARWPGRVSAWSDRGQWLADMWGPPPGQPGCKVPLKFLSAIPQKPGQGAR